MKKLGPIIFLFFLLSDIHSQILVEGKGIDSLFLGIKESKVKELLGNNFSRVTYSDDYYELIYLNPSIKIYFDNDSIVDALYINTNSNLSTKKGLKIHKNLKIADVEKVYGTGEDSWYVSDDSTITAGYDCGISFITSAFYPNGKLANTMDTNYVELKVLEVEIVQCEGDCDFTFYEYLDGVYIPKNLNESIYQIDNLLDKKAKEEIREMRPDEFIGSSHMSLGRWIRNNWGLWNESRLSVYFKEYKIEHPDEISVVILFGYYHKLHGGELSIKEIINKYKNFNKKIEDN